MGDHLSYTGSCQRCDACCAPLWLTSYEHTRVHRVLPNSLKGWAVCCHVYVTSAHKGTCVVHRNMPNHHTSTYHEWVYVQMLHRRAKWQKRGTALPERVVLYAPQGVDLEGGGSPLRRNDTEWKKWPVQETLWSTVDKTCQSSQCAI